MNISNILAGNGLRFSATDGTNANARFNASGKNSMINSAFHSNSVCTGKTSPRFKQYIVTHLSGRQENWCISNYFSVSPGEARYLTSRIRQDVKNTDFSGMTDVEIYAWIENKFIETFGENFRMAFTLRMPDPKMPGDRANADRWAFKHVGVTFYDIVGRQFGGKTAAADVNRKRLFGHVSNADIQDNIMDRFPSHVKLTNRCLAQIFAELNSVGMFSFNVGKLISAHIIELNDSGAELGFPPECKAGELFAKALDRRVNLPILFGLLNKEIRSDESCPFMIIEQREFYVRHLGAELCPRGLLIPDYFDQFNFDWEVEFNLENLLVDLEEELLETLDEHDLYLAEKEKAAENLYKPAWLYEAENRRESANQANEHNTAKV